MARSDDIKWQMDKNRLKMTKNRNCRKADTIFRNGEPKGRGGFWPKYLPLMECFLHHDEYKL